MFCTNRALYNIIVGTETFKNNHKIRTSVLLKRTQYIFVSLTPKTNKQTKLRNFYILD